MFLEKVQVFNLPQHFKFTGASPVDFAALAFIVRKEATYEERYFQFQLQYAFGHAKFS